MLRIFSLLSIAVLMAPAESEAGPGGVSDPDPSPAPPSPSPPPLDFITGTLIVGAPTLQDQAKTVGDLHDAYATAKTKAASSSAAAHDDAIAMATAHGALKQGIDNLVAAAKAMDSAEDAPTS
jgi:hypothetical protein